MAENVEETSSGLDKIKLVLSLSIVVAGIWGFYQYADQPVLYRALGLIGIVIAAALLALTTAKGRSLASFMQTARTEVRKMVWPTRGETVQTTLYIMVMVFLVGLFLWLLDMGLGALLRLLIG